jgi:hypothetical protein
VRGLFEVGFTCAAVRPDDRLQPGLHISVVGRSIESPIFLRLYSFTGRDHPHEFRKHSPGRLPQGESRVTTEESWLLRSHWRARNHRPRRTSRRAGCTLHFPQHISSSEPIPFTECCLNNNAHTARMARVVSSTACSSGPRSVKLTTARKLGSRCSTQAFS